MRDRYCQRKRKRGHGSSHHCGTIYQQMQSRRLRVYHIKPSDLGRRIGNDWGCVEDDDIGRKVFADIDPTGKWHLRLEPYHEMHKRLNEGRVVEAISGVDYWCEACKQFFTATSGVIDGTISVSKHCPHCNHLVKGPAKRIVIYGGWD